MACRRPRALATAWLLLSIACGGAGPAQDSPPNVVLLIGDDHGFGDFGFMGSEVVQTPRLDRLSAEGATFPLGYSTASLCRPALRTLLTGLEPYQYGLHERAREDRRSPGAAGRLVADLETLPRLLARRGYVSFQAGKYAEGSYADGGFSEGQVTGEEPIMEVGSQLVRETMDPVLDFVDRNLDHPFFLWFAPKLPHLPHDAPPAFRALYDGMEVRPTLRRYYAAISWFDDAVGRLVDHIEERGLGNRTLFVYVVDNGWDPRPSGTQFAMLGGDRGKKTLHDLGFRTPVVLRFRGRIGPGLRSDALVSLLDVYPTVLDYAGLEAPADRLGHSLRPLVEGDGGDWPREAFVGWIPHRRIRDGKPGGSGHYWRDDRWHYVKPARGDPSLYDLARDPDERRDVSAEHPEIVRRAEGAITLWGLDVERRFRESG